MQRPGRVRNCARGPLQLSAHGRVWIVLGQRINKRKVDFEILCVDNVVKFMHLFTVL